MLQEKKIYKRSNILIYFAISNIFNKMSNDLIYLTDIPLFKFECIKVFFSLQGISDQPNQNREI